MYKNHHDEFKQKKKIILKCFVYTKMPLFLMSRLIFFQRYVSLLPYFLKGGLFTLLSPAQRRYAALIFARRCQDTIMHWLLLMTFTQQMRIEFVHIIQLFPAYVAFPGITFTVATLVQEIQSLVGKFYATEQACEYLFAIYTTRIAFRTCRCNRTITNGRGGRGSRSTCWRQTALYHIIIFHGSSIAGNTIVSLCADATFKVFAQQRL